MAREDTITEIIESITLNKMSPKMEKNNMLHCLHSASSCGIPFGRPRLSGSVALESDVDLLRDIEGVIDFKAEIPDCALDLGVSQQQLHGSHVTRPAIDQGSLCPAQRMGPEAGWVEPNAGDPLRD